MFFGGFGVTRTESSLRVVGYRLPLFVSFVYVEMKSERHASMVPV